jgi:nucleotide-binding universal stress UspA family protein
MQDIRKIIVPVDFHQHTEDLAEYSTGIASALGAKITFLHVVEEVAYFSEYSPDAFTRIDEELRIYAENKMAAFLEKNKVSCPGCTGLVLTGDVADSIVEYADEQDADLIIIATHGKQGIEKILLGSVAQRVLKRVHCPTLVFNPYRGDRGYQINSPISEAVLQV